MLGLPDPITFVIVLVGMSLMPFAVVMTTSFAKISVVLMILRNALGLQQVPPNLIVYGVTLIMTVFILQPVLHDVSEVLITEDRQFETVEDWSQAYEDIKVPFTGYLKRFAAERERAFFLQATQKLWTPDAAAAAKDDDLIILVPAFIVSELTRAFEIGFLLYLPFVVIDLIVSNILIALGAIMVSPLTISLPIKLFLFVLVDGWTRLLHGLILSYAI